MLDMIKFSALAFGMTLVSAFPVENVKRAGVTANDVPIVNIHDPISEPQNFLQIYKDGSTWVDQILQFTASNSSKLHQNKVDNGADLPGSTFFDFVPVDSTFMQYDNGNCLQSPPSGLCYGHMRVHDPSTSASDLVLSVNYPGRADGKSVYLDHESQSDDSSQLLQFFSFDTSSKELQFIGAMKNETGDPAYGWQGPFSAEGWESSNGLVRIANVDDAEGHWEFRNLRSM